MDVRSDFATVIDAIFGKLAIRYGAAWLRQWDGVDISLVKADWMDELSGFASNLEPLRYALRNLPERCPNVAQFRALANACPPPEFKQLPAPVANPEQVANAIAQQAGVKQAINQRRDDGKDWARKLKARHEHGEKLGPHQITAYRQALGLEGRQSWQ